jgi:EAL domain-containing protein (putative c-di-GMP-specific phosphodiesterase class I)
MGAAPVPPAPDAECSTRPRLLVVDDDEILLRSFVRVLTSDYEVDACCDGVEAVKALSTNTYDAILSDIDMPRLSGLALLERVRAVDLDIPVVLITGNPCLDTAMAAVEYGALRYVPKPIDAAGLRAVAANAVRLHRLARAKRSALDLVRGADRHVGNRAGLVASFGRALRTLWMAYQPIVSLSRSKIFGYEALLRSEEPTLSNPGLVLDAAEKLDRLHDLGRTIRAAAAAPAAMLPEATILFVNLHPRDLLDEELFRRDQPLACIAGRVVLEITERASLHHVLDVQARVARLREMGFRIAVDDLGAGYAGLTTFSLLEPEVVKLDMSLVRNVHAQPTKLTLARTMIAMCRELGMQVVAEGIETPEERDAIAWAGCDLVQGYLFAKPGVPYPSVNL